MNKQLAGLADRLPEGTHAAAIARRLSAAPQATVEKEVTATREMLLGATEVPRDHAGRDEDQRWAVINGLDGLEEK